ncbi:hypothetical protein V5799_023193 [Amblyomma americanum]|uniref:Integrator complex subunit 10 n=1 Tax=Amblyomma americanum TaxID=6943 RepID=A0AAQ4FK24_AMBAM
MLFVFSFSINQPTPSSVSYFHVMAPGNAMKESETDEEYLISMARGCQKSDPYFTKSWMLTAKTLFPENFGIQYEAYCLAADSGNIKEASSYLEEMFRKFPSEHRLWDEVYKIANALRADTLDAEATFLRGIIFGWISLCAVLIFVLIIA